MKKKTLSMLLVLVLLILAVPAGIADAKAQPQDIAFDLSGSWSEEGINPETGEPVEADYAASVYLTGKTSEKGEAQYLTPLHGTLDVEGTEYKIQVKQIKQSEPLYSSETRWDVPDYFSLDYTYTITSSTSGVIEVNAEGSKFIGFLEWHITTQYDTDDEMVGEPYGGSTLVLFGIVDGKSVSASLDGVAPVIE